MIERLELSTPDGPCAMTLATPDRAGGPWPAVLFCMDGGGLREALDGMAQRIADGGHVVAMPDLYHRVGSVMDLVPAGQPRTMRSLAGAITDPALRQRLMAHYVGSAMNDDHARMDLGAALAYLDGRPDVRRGPVGATGYCMGGNIALRAAILFPDRVAAAASFHGGSLCADTPDAPVHRVAAIRAEVYIGGAAEDAGFTDAHQERMRAALEAAGVTHTIEIYPGTRHGFAVPDHPVYEPEAAARHEAALLALFARRL